jgi:hypothetical protein
VEGIEHLMNGYQTTSEFDLLVVFLRCKTSEEAANSFGVQIFMAYNLGYFRQFL